MEIGLPKEVKDIGAFTHWLNKLVQWCKRNTLYSSSDILVHQTTTGTTLTLAKKINPYVAVSTPAVAAASTVQPFQITKLNNEDWFTAVPILGSNSTGSATRIAKSPRLRTSISGETIDGVSITYSSYTLDNSFVSSDGINSRSSVMFPRYVALTGSYAGPTDTSIIYATPVTFTGITVSGSAVTWLEISPARVRTSRYIL